MKFPIQKIDMKRIGLTFAGVTLFLLFVPAHAAFAQHGLIGKTYPSERKVVENKALGYEVTQWTTTGKNNHLYFNIESFIDKDHFFFYSDRSGKMNLFEMNMSTAL